MTTRDEFQKGVERIVNPYEKLKPAKQELAKEFGIDIDDIEIYKVSGAFPGNQRVKVVVFNPQDYFANVDEDDVNWNFFTER